MTHLIIGSRTSGFGAYPEFEGPMAWISRLRTLPLRTKVAVTFAGVVALVLAVSTYFSFRYWQREFLAASEQMASLAAASQRAALESTLTSGRIDDARRSLARVVESSPVSSARVHGQAGIVLVSSDPSEEGSRPGGGWIPSPDDLPREGILKQTPDGETMLAYLPLSLDGRRDGVLEIELPVGAVKAALERGAYLGQGLMLVSFVALGIIVVTLLEREVVSPLQRIENALSSSEGVGSRSRDEVGRLAASVDRILERERKAEERAEETERQLAAQEGLAEVGGLAAEMAHEFKRPLASIRTAIDVLQQEYELDKGGQQVLGEVNHQLERLTETMRDLFALARPMALETEPLDLTDVADEALMEARCLMEADVHVERRYAQRIPSVVGDRHRLEQAILNLLCNAAEATPDAGTVTLGITVGEGSVSVVVSDTGVGMSADELERVVRPFYSTKPTGTGLGLPLVLRIARAHAGHLELDSAPGQGTTARLILPTRSTDPNPREASEWHPSGSSSSTTTT
ncbi:MAG TPA: ATP-binding protein [Longimicrobiales bacterium]|jgi:signal transduction histidine kinase